MFKIPNSFKLGVEICGGWWSAMSGAASIPFGFLALFVAGSPRFWFAVLAYVGLWVFAIRILSKNYKIVSGTSDPSDHLEIDDVDCDMATLRNKFCKVKITNMSPRRSAIGVRIQVVALDDSLQKEAGAYFRPELPFALTREAAMDQILNPGESANYNLFKLTIGAGVVKDMNTGEVVRHKYAIANFTERQEAKNVTQFYYEGKYQMRLLATARGFTKTEQTFDIGFNGDRFTLTKVAI
jgi:hypothetical protein